MNMWAQKQKGFTIVELLIVVVVIAILAAITMVSFNGIQTQARDSARSSAAKHIRTALEVYKADNGDMYPNACGTVNMGCSSTTLASALVPKYISEVPRDPSTGVSINYVVGTGQSSYGLLVQYESKPACKFLVGDTAVASWWGSGVPVC